MCVKVYVRVRATACMCVRSQDYAAIQEGLGLDSGEAILESFKCSLLQTYTPANNPFTPDRQVRGASWVVGRRPPAKTPAPVCGWEWVDAE